MIEEFQKKLAELKLEFRFRDTQYNKYFRSLNSIKEFFEKELEFWNELTSGEVRHTRQKYMKFNNFIRTVSTQLENETTTVDTAIRDYRTNLNAFNNKPLYNFYSKSDVSKRLKWLYQNKDVNHSNGFWKFLNNTQINSNNFGEFFGATDAYRMTNKWVTNDDASNTEIEFKKSIKEYDQKIDDLNSKYDEMYNQKSAEYKTMLDSSTDYKDKTEAQLNMFIDERKKTLENIELQYRESLRLKAPADYWKKLEEHYNTRGSKWMKWSVGFTIGLVLYLSIILYQLPALLDVEIDLYSLDSLRGTIIFALSVSMIIYLIRLFVKLSMSSYHLARDAKERYQLSHIYLSLINDNAISEEDRSIVLQSLFSRADTGLLKGDSSPAIPDSITKQLFKMNGPV